MVKKLKVHHITVPLFLIFCLIIAGLILGYRLDSRLILELSMMAIFLYVFFAFTYHHFDKSVNLEVILEYILMAALALVVVVGTLYY